MKEYLLEAIDKERDAVNALSTMPFDQCEQVIKTILECKGNIIFMGVGKSAHIGAKLAATYASLGIPSYFVHATESMHGDLGMINYKDIIMLLSNSGNTMEMIQLIEPLQDIGCTCIAICSDETSYLAKHCGMKIIYPKVIEADENNLAPTSSTTLVMVLGDAIACTISKIQQFQKKDFYKYHPGGSLGEKLKISIRNKQ